MKHRLAWSCRVEMQDLFKERQYLLWHGMFEDRRFLSLYWPCSFVTWEKQSYKLELHFWLINFCCNSKVDPVAGIWVQLFHFIQKWMFFLFVRELSDLGHRMIPPLLWMFVWLVNADICYRCFFMVLRGPQLSRVSQQMHHLSSHLCQWYRRCLYESSRQTPFTKRLTRLVESTMMNNDNQAVPRECW